MMKATVAAGVLGLAGVPLANSAPNATLDYDWNSIASGVTWSNSTLWTPAVVGGPDGTGLYVRINTAIAADATINLFNTGDAGDAVKTVGRLDIGSSGGTARQFILATGTGAGVLDFNGNGGNAQLNMLSTGNNVIVSAPVTLSTSLELTNNAAGGARLELSGAISGTGGLLVKNGPGMIRLTNSGSTYSGGLTLEGGLLDVQNAGAFGSGAITLAGGTLKNGTSGGITASNAVSINGDFSFNQSAAGSTNRDMTFSGAATLGTASGTSRTITVATGGASAGTLAFTNVVSNGTTANTIIKEGAGTLRFNNKANTFTQLVVNAGVVNYNGSVLVSGDTPFGTSAIELGQGATLSISGGSNSNLGTAIILKGDGILSPTLTGGFGTTFSGVISETGGSRKLTVGFGAITGNVSAILGNTNTYTGGTDFNGGTSTAGIATLTANAVNAFGGGAAGTGGVLRFVTPAGGAVSRVSLGANQSIAGVTNTTAGTFSVEGNNSGAFRTLRINNTSGGTGDGSSFAGSFGTGTAGASNGNSLHLVKDGTGVQILTGTSTYTGTTSVDGGSLIVNGSLAGNGAVSVASAGLLGGNGSIAGATTVGGGLSAGHNGAGTVTFNSSLTVLDGASLFFDAGDAITVGGALTIGSGSTINVSLNGYSEGQTVTLFSVAGTKGVEDDVVFNVNGVLTSGAFVGNDFQITVGAIPEPSSYAMVAGLGFLGYATLRRRRSV